MAREIHEAHATRAEWCDQLVAIQQHAASERNGRLLARVAPCPMAMVTLWRVVAWGSGPGSHAPRLQGQKAADREDE